MTLQRNFSLLGGCFRLYLHPLAIKSTLFYPHGYFRRMFCNAVKQQSRGYEVPSGLTFKISHIQSSPRDANKQKSKQAWPLFGHDSRSFAFFPLTNIIRNRDRAIFINVSFSLPRAWHHWSMNYDQLGQQVSFHEHILSHLWSWYSFQWSCLGEKSSVSEHTSGSCISRPTPCLRVYQAVNLCSFLKAKTNEGLLSFLLGCKHREIPLLLTYPTWDSPFKHYFCCAIFEQ